MLTLRRVAKSLFPLAAVVTVTAGLACAVAERTPATAMPAPAYQDATSFSVEPTRVQKAQWRLQAPHEMQNSETESATARFVGVGALALVLAAAFALVLMMFDHMMRRPNGPRRNS